MCGKEKTFIHGHEDTTQIQLNSALKVLLYERYKKRKCAIMYERYTKKK